MTKPHQRLWPLLILLTGCLSPNPAYGPLVGELTTGSEQITVQVMASDVSSDAGWPYLGGIEAAADGSAYVLDQRTYQIRKISPDGQSSPFAGTPGTSDPADGRGPSASLFSPTGFTRDTQGNLWFAENVGPALVRRASPDGTVTTVVRRTALPDQAAVAASVIADRTGGVYLHTSTGSLTQTVWQVETSALRKVTSVTATNPAGPIPAWIGLTAAPVSGLFGLTYDRKLQAIQPSGTTTVVRTFAPQGDPATTLMGVPMAISADTAGNVYVLGRRSIDQGSWQAQTPSWFIQKVDATGVITPVLSCRYPSLDATPFPGIRIATSVMPPAWLRPLAMSYGTDGKLYVADSVENRVLRISLPPR